MIEISLKKTILVIFAILFFISVGFNVWLGYQLSLAVNAYERQQIDTKTVEFTKLFIEDVLMANTEISFDTRLVLETSVRSLNDQQIFDQWKRFTDATTKEDASNQAKFLLRLLVKKIGN